MCRKQFVSESHGLQPKHGGMCLRDDDVGAVLTPGCASWAGLLLHTIKRLGCQLALLLATAADIALFQHLPVSLKDTTPVRFYSDRDKLHANTEA